MRKTVALILAAAALFTLNTAAAAESGHTVYVDGKGVMRWSDTRKEAVFFGTNYTLPFAHAYRAMGYLGVDRKEAIRKDVYHLARLGLNAYRVHLWDQELTDRSGNLLDNDHLDLLDYLIKQVQARGMYVLITFQTDFGNGYPERDNSPAGYSSPYSREEVLRNPQAIAAQKNYIRQLMAHVNRYTGKTVKDDPCIVGFELTNEPNHTGTMEDVKGYVNTLVESVRESGCSKPVFYNVAQSPYYAPAIYASDIQGVTFQWYPEGLVAGHTRKGNFLPCVDRYVTPFDTLKAAAGKAKIVYEFDPADILYSYMYPAMARSFRSAGFQWMTQFAYDPLDMAAYNTEYQTHYMNLAYVPRKALSLKIAAEAARRVPCGKTYGAYPADTVFEHIRVSHNEDLSELNDGKLFWYSNSTTTQPLSPSKLESVAGWGNSPVVSYEGTGAYFLDKLEKGVWRLEVMPDAMVVADPYEKPSFRKKVARVFYNAWDMTLNLPDLGSDFTIRPLNRDGEKMLVEKGTVSHLQPGVYLLEKRHFSARRTYRSDTPWNNILLGEFVAPGADKSGGYSVVSHTPAIVSAGTPLKVNVEVAGDEWPDSVIVMTDQVSFWNKENPYVRLQRTKGFTYTGTLAVPDSHTGNSLLRYNVIVCREKERETFPQGVKGMPLDWDFTDYSYYETKVLSPGRPLTLVNAAEDTGLETYMLPAWTSERRSLKDDNPAQPVLKDFTFSAGKTPTRFFLRKELGDLLKGLDVSDYNTLCIQTGAVPDSLEAGFVTSDGFTYTLPCTPAADGIIRLPLKNLKQGRTALLPQAFPSFQPAYFEPDTAIPFDIRKADILQLSFTGLHLQLGAVWLEKN